MILLNSTLCSKDFRKVGLVLSCGNIFLQTVCVVAAIIMHAVSAAGVGSQYYDPPYYIPRCYYDQGLRGDCWYYSQALRNLLIDAILFLSLDIILYSILVYGLITRKSSALTVWLAYSIIEFILLQACLLVATFAMSINVNIGMGIFSISAYILIAVYACYHRCVIFSARHEFIHRTSLINTNRIYAYYNASAAMANSPHVPPVQFGVGVPQYNIHPQSVVIPATSSTFNQYNLPTAVSNEQPQPSIYSS